MNALTFFVQGLPITQAGMKPVPDGKGGFRLITTGGNELEAWRSKVTQVAGWSANLNTWKRLIDCPVSVELTFFLPMPKDRSAAVRARGIDLHFVRPDIDKLTRAVHDSLTKAEVYKDDGQVARSAVDKLAIFNRALCGVEVRVTPVEADDGYLAHALLRRQTHRINALG